jgi:anti-anti-sigma factor
MNEDHSTSPLGFAITDEKVISNAEVHLTLDGHLDAEGAPILSDALGQKLERGVRSVTLIFDRVQFISSTGIGTLIAAIGEFRDVGGDVIIKGLSNELREVFEMLDLLDYVTVG